jgi:hypothetical protein
MNLLNFFILLSVAFYVGGCTKSSNPLSGQMDLSQNHYYALSGPIDSIQYISYLKECALAGTSLKWNYRNILLPEQNGFLYWTIEFSCKDEIDARRAIRQALQLWQPYVPFSFAETSDVNAANMVIRFLNTDDFENESGEKVPWWQGGSVLLAYGFSPKASCRGLRFDYIGDIFVNDRFIDWKEPFPRIYRPKNMGNGEWSSQATLVKVLTHEIGHALGLAHNEASLKNIMSPNGPTTNDGRLHDGDILSITQLYTPAYHMVYGQDFCKRMVTDAYRKILERQPTPRELALHSEKLAFNRLPSRKFYDYRVLLGDLAGSGENWSRAGGCDTIYIENLYHSLLDRRPTDREREFWKRCIKSGKNAPMIAPFLMRTAEWNHRFIAWVDSSQLVGARHDSTVAMAAMSISSESADPQRVIYDHIRSAEYYAASGDPPTSGSYIRRLYVTLLKREVDADHFGFWMAWID